MADLIDRAVPKEFLLKHGFYFGIVRRALENAPVVDAVEVVRCIKCEMHDNCYTEDVFKFARMDLEKAFCCLGKERRTDAID